MLKHLLLAFALVVLLNAVAQAQSSCACSVELPDNKGGCSQNQVCPPGYIAKCICTSAGCSGICLPKDSLPPEGGIQAQLRMAAPQDIGRILSSFSDLEVSFKPRNEIFSLVLPKGEETSSWDILEELSRYGEVKINGQDLSFWKEVKNVLLKGGEFKISFGEATPQRLLNTLSFISGKRYSITSGNPDLLITGQIHARNLDGVLALVEAIGQIVISEKK